MTDPGGRFASESSTKHSPRVDDELEHELRGEPVDPDPTGTLVGGTPVGMTPDGVETRAELARWLDRADFPSTGPALVEAARAHEAPDEVVAELQRLPDGETYERVGDVVRALGYPTES